ncbi:MAG: peptidoglycan-binding protein [Clostridiales bacterium]|nr:peptidoglycan-binding protein [Clostridiales bacterium]
MGIGYLSIEAYTADEALPVNSARISVTDSSGSVLYTMATDENGVSPAVQLEAPDISHTLDPNDPGPHYGSYDVEVSASGYDSSVIRGVQILDQRHSILPVNLTPMAKGQRVVYTNEIAIPKNALEVASTRVAYTPPTLPRILPDVAIPSNVRVHLAAPSAWGQNVTVSFTDYIKNCASSEIYATWPVASLEANILCEISLLLNRIYTEWYPSKGYDFDITNNTQYDQAFVYGRNIFQEISVVVDRIFNEYVRRAGHKEPYYTEYCNGTTSTCPGLSQWGTVPLAESGMNALQILKQYYPDDIEIAETYNIKDAPQSYPGYSLSEGSQSDFVKAIQNQLNRIRENYPLIPQIRNPNGVFGYDTENAVKVFQQTFGLSADGIVGKATWYKISAIYAAVKKLAELGGEGDVIGPGATPPTTAIREGSKGTQVAKLQFLLNYIGMFYPGVESVIENATFDAQTKASVESFQTLFGLTPDGIVGPATWRLLYDIYNGIDENVQIPEPPDETPSPVYPYPGYILKEGSRGEDVLLLQKMLNQLSVYYPQVPRISEDGVFGNGTKGAVQAFQYVFGLDADGIVGPATWNAIAEKYAGISGSTQKPSYPGYALNTGASGEEVRLVQNYINALSVRYPSIPRISVDGIYGTGTKEAVRAFQRLFSLTADGIVGPSTWKVLVDQYYAVRDNQSARSVQSGSYPTYTQGVLQTQSASLNEADYSEISLTPDTDLDYDVEPAAYTQDEALGSEYGTGIESQITDLHDYENPYQEPALDNSNSGVPPTPDRGAIQPQSPFDAKQIQPTPAQQANQQSGYPVSSATGAKKQDSATSWTLYGYNASGASRDDDQDYRGRYVPVTPATPVTPAQSGCGCGKQAEVQAQTQATVPAQTPVQPQAQTANPCEGLDPLNALATILLLQILIGDGGLADLAKDEAFEALSAQKAAVKEEPKKKGCRC